MREESAGRGQRGGGCRVILLLVDCAGEQADLHRPCLEGDGCEAGQDAPGSSGLMNSTLAHIRTPTHSHTHTGLGLLLDSFVIVKSAKRSESRATFICRTVLQGPQSFFFFFLTLRAVASDNQQGAAFLADERGLCGQRDLLLA